MEKKITLKAARVNAGYTQEQLANAIGVHRNTIASWESNPKELTIKEAEKICKVLNIKFNQIFFNSNLQNVD